MEGWIKLHRGLVDNQLWRCEPFTRGQAWVDLLLLANFNHSYFFKRGVKIEVERGQVARSEVELADRWKWSRTKVRKFLNDLEKEQQIEQYKTNVTQLITVVNYNYYQEKEQQHGQQKDSRKTAEKQQKNTLEEGEEREESKESEEDNIHPLQDVSENPSDPLSVNTENSIFSLDNSSADRKPSQKDKKAVTGEKQSKAVDYEAILNLYHQECPSFNRIVKLSDARKAKIRTRLDEMPEGIETLRTVFRKMEASDFCKGENDSGWKATFDWLIENTNNWLKVIEGNYDNKPQADHSNIHQSKSFRRGGTIDPNDQIFCGLLKSYSNTLLSNLNNTDFPMLNPEYIELAKAFQALFRANLQEAGAATTTADNATGASVDDIRMLIENDKYTIGDLHAVYSFLQKDAFWKQNILSTSNLREKMAQLKLKIYNGNGNSRTNNKEATSWSELAQIVADSFANRS